MISLRSLELTAGGFAAGPLDLEVNAGEYAVLLGPSGAGKTLVLEAIAGVRAISAGRVVVAGEDVTSMAPDRRHVGLVFQDGLLFPHLTVAGNIAYGLSRGERGMSGRRRRHASPRVHELAAIVGVPALLERRPATLSGGERQRAALARALAARPRALLLDEPLNAIDFESREALQDVLRQVSRAEGVTVLHVTHDCAEAFALADTCAVLVDGRLRQIGPPREVLQRPADAEVARFLGARNVLRATRDPDDPHVARLAAGGKLCAAAPLPAALDCVVVRPEDVQLWHRDDAPPRGGNLVDGKVQRLVLQGGQVLVTVETPTLFEALLPLRQADGFGLTAGMEVALAIPPEAVHAIASR